MIHLHRLHDIYPALMKTKPQFRCHKRLATMSSWPQYPALHCLQRETDCTACARELQDNTLWTPELYQLKSPPKAWKNIRLFEGAVAALNELVDAPEWSDVRVAAASRANKIKEAHRLLTEFKLAGGTSLSELFVACEVYPGSKKKHFGQIRKKTGISYDRYSNSSNCMVGSYRHLFDCIPDA